MGEWQIIEGKLTKELTFKDFKSALGFVNKVAQLAEELNHHPDILIHSYKNVRIILFTHSENKITEQDRELSSRIDLL